MDWLVAEFGRDILLRPIALPTDVIPDGYDGSREAATELCGRVDGRMDLRPGQCGLSFELDGVRRSSNRGTTVVVKEQHGRWSRGAGQNQIELSPTLAADPVALIAIYAHEVGHELLLGGDRISLTRRPDHEPLTDLITVFYGLGIFTANAAYERRPRPNGRGKQPVAAVTSARPRSPRPSRTTPYSEANADQIGTAIWTHLYAAACATSWRSSTADWGKPSSRWSG